MRVEKRFNTLKELQQQLRTTPGLGEV